MFVVVLSKTEKPLTKQELRLLTLDTLALVFLPRIKLNLFPDYQAHYINGYQILPYFTCLELRHCITYTYTSNNLLSLSFPSFLKLDGNTTVTSISEEETLPQAQTDHSIVDNLKHLAPPHSSSDFIVLDTKYLSIDIFCSLSSLSLVNPQIVF